MRRVLSYLSILFFCTISIAFAENSNSGRSEICAEPSIISEDPLIGSPPPDSGTEQMLGPSNADKIQAWVNTNAPEAKTLEEVADAVLGQWDADGNGSLGGAEVLQAVKDLDLGHPLCSTEKFAKKMLEKFDKSGGGRDGTQPDGKVDKGELTNGLKGEGITAPKAP